MIREFYVHPERGEEINKTLFVLIPRVENPKNFKQLRSIGLCNVIYKVIVKIMTNGLKPLMPLLVAPNQCSLVKRRHNSDNVVIA